MLEYFNKNLFMKNLFLTIGLTVFAFLCLEAQVVTFSQTVEEADIKVARTMDEAEADLLVYRCDSQEEAVGNSGLWFFTREAGEAVKTITFVNEEQQADLTVMFVQNKADAKWINKSKKHLFE